MRALFQGILTVLAKNLKNPKNPKNLQNPKESKNDTFRWRSRKEIVSTTCHAHGVAL